MMERDPSGNHIVEAMGNGGNNDESSSDMPEFPQGADDEKSRFRRFTCNSSSALDTEREKTIYPPKAVERDI